VKQPKVPIKELRELYLAVADMVDAGDCGDPLVDMAYKTVFEIPWGQKLYGDAVEASNARLK
jgi:hypothetical protein